MVFPTFFKLSQSNIKFHSVTQSSEFNGKLFIYVIKSFESVRCLYAISSVSRILLNSSSNVLVVDVLLSVRLTFIK